MSDAPLQFAHPELVDLLWGWLVIVVVLVLLERRRGDALDRLVGPSLRERLVDRPARWRRWARLVLIAISGFAMGLALMQPQWGVHYVATPRVGAEIMIALDVSRSMLADDAKPSRLERAKAEISDLLSYLDDDYVGLIVFAGKATMLSPLTPDKNYLRLALESAGPQSVSRGGTKLAEPILRTVAGMGKAGPAQRALILITDGEDHDSFALDAAKEAAAAGIKIITIGFGDEAGSEIYVRDPKTGARTLLRDHDGRPVVSRLDGDLLREIALATDGAFVPAGTGVLDLQSIYDAHIARLTRGQLDERGRSIRDEVYQAPLVVAIVCLIASALVASGRRRARAGAAGLGAALILALAPVPAAQAKVENPASAVSPTPQGSVLSDPSHAPDAPQTLRAPGSSNALPSSDAVASEANDAAGTGAPATPEAPPESPRERFNHANALLEKGDVDAAIASFRDARRDAADDPELRYAATYNLGMASVARAEKLRADKPEQALEGLHEAADWFREAASARPKDLDPRHNLDVTLRKALILSDEIAHRSESKLEDEIDALAAQQREQVAKSGALFEQVARAGELEAADQLREAFRDAATAQRLVVSDANTLADRVSREHEALLAKSEDQRTPEDALRLVQLDGVLTHLDSAIDRMGQTRRQLRQRRAERAYRRGSSALEDLKRARDQLRDPVEQIGVLLGEVGGLARATSAVAKSGLMGKPAAEPDESVDPTLAKPSPSTSPTSPTSPPLPPPLPLALDRESLEDDAAGIEARVQELASRFENAAQQAAKTGASAAGPAAANKGDAAADPERAEAMRKALEAATPLVSQAASAMGEAKGAIGQTRLDLALHSESEAGESLAAAQEQFFDLRQLLDASYADELRISTVAGSQKPAVVEGRDEYRDLLARLQTKNSERALRLDDLLARERKQKIEQLEAEAAKAGKSPKPNDEASDPVAAERKRYDLASERLALASGAMAETSDAFAHPGKGGAVDWPKAGEASKRATDQLDEVRMLFFSIAEHVRKLAVDQLDLNDRTRDAIVLAAGDPSTTAAQAGAANSSQPPSPSSAPSSTPSPAPAPAAAPPAAGAQPPAATPAPAERSEETLHRTRELATNQSQLEGRGRAIADALLAQSEQQGAAGPTPTPSPGATPEAGGPGGKAERDRIRTAADHVEKAELAMKDAAGVLEDQKAALPPAQQAQALAVDELKQALALLSPPPPPPQDKPDSKDQKKQQKDSGSGQGQDQAAAKPQPQPESQKGDASQAAKADENEDQMGDPSQLLQGVRDREAERRRDKELDAQQRRRAPVEKDW